MDGPTSSRMETTGDTTTEVSAWTEEILPFPVQQLSWFGCPKENHFSKGLGKSGDYVVTLVNNKPSPETSDDDIDYGYDYYDGVEPHH